MAKVESHRDLIVWQKALRLAVEIYRLSAMFPSTEEYRLTAQITRAAASVPANIAEGHARGTRRHYANFLVLPHQGSLGKLRLGHPYRESLLRRDTLREPDPTPGSGSLTLAVRIVACRDRVIPEYLAWWCTSSA